MRGGQELSRIVQRRQTWPCELGTAEFEHRLSKPIYQTQTKADGSYKMEGIEEGAYNLVAVRQGYGWKYLFEVEAEKMAKTVTAEDIMLYPEMEVSGTISEYMVWPSEHDIIAIGGEHCGTRHG